VRLLDRDERAKRLFGKERADVAAYPVEEGAVDIGQLTLFPEEHPPAGPRVKARTKARTDKVEHKNLRACRVATTLDRVHAAMPLQRSGRTNALKKPPPVAEIQRGPEFLRPANALSALYSKESEKRDCSMLCFQPRQGADHADAIHGERLQVARRQCEVAAAHGSVRP
jgi:hypothetical protein